MPITYTVDRQRRRVDATAEGHVGYPEILAHIEEQRSEGILDLSELVDGVRATSHLTSDNVRQIVNRLRSLGTRFSLGPAALVVTDDYTFGMLRMLGMLVEEFCDVQPFRSREEAEIWLNSIPGPRPPRPQP